ncbi:MAG: hypothetical protein ACRD19_13315, partial [Terriglobia bacterium]
MKLPTLKSLLRVGDGRRHYLQMIAGCSKFGLVAALAVFCGLGSGASDARAAVLTSPAPQLMQGAA